MYFVLFSAVLVETVASAKSYSRIFLHVKDCLTECLPTTTSSVQPLPWRVHSFSWYNCVCHTDHSVVLQWMGTSMLCQSFPNRAQQIVLANLLFFWKLSVSVFFTLEGSSWALFAAGTPFARPSDCVHESSCHFNLPGPMVLFIVQSHNSSRIKISWPHGLVHHSISQ